MSKGSINIKLTLSAVLGHVGGPLSTSARLEFSCTSFPTCVMAELHLWGGSNHSHLKKKSEHRDWVCISLLVLEKASGDVAYSFPPPPAPLAHRTAAARGPGEVALLRAVPHFHPPPAAGAAAAAPAAAPPPPTLPAEGQCH